MTQVKCAKKTSEYFFILWEKTLFACVKGKIVKKKYVWFYYIFFQFLNCIIHIKYIKKWSLHSSWPNVCIRMVICIKCNIVWIYYSWTKTKNIWVHLLYRIWNYCDLAEGKLLKIRQLYATFAAYCNGHI